MTTLIPTRLQAPRAVFDAARLVLQAWRRRRQARGTIATLHGLPDFVLKDIGLRRGEIDHRFG